MRSNQKKTVDTMGIGESQMKYDVKYMKFRPECSFRVEMVPGEDIDSGDDVFMLTHINTEKHGWVELVTPVAFPARKADIILEKTHDYPMFNISLDGDEEYH
jgi:hypothetical protein